MNELSSDARSLLARTRAAHEPEPAERERVRRALAARLAAGAMLTASAASATSAANAASAASAGTTAASSFGGFLLMKAMLGGFLLGTLAVGASLLATGEAGTSAPAKNFAAASARPRAEPLARDVAVSPRAADEFANTQPVPSLPTASSAAPGKSESATASGASSMRTARPGDRAGGEQLVPDNVDRGLSDPVASSLGAFPVPTAVTASAGAPQKAPPAPSDSERLTAEARALAEVQRALDQGSPAVALELLNRHERQFVGGALAQERSAARVFVLCALGRRLDAQREGARFLAAAPQSPLSARVKAACAERDASR